jgi:hypothetical protein
MVPLSIATSYCFPVRLSVIVKVFALMGFSPGGPFDRLLFWIAKAD